MALDIIAIEYVSLSEIQTVAPHYTKEYFDENPDELKSVLYSLGMEVYDYPHEEQYNTHRNRLGNTITTWRWVGNSRIDKEWLSSGYASIEARDKSLKNSLLIESYKMRGLVEVV